MRNSVVGKSKKLLALLLAAGMCVSGIPSGTLAATTSTAQNNGTFTNPVIYSDVPDEDVIRVGDTYYMVSTTMHLSPGCPIMKSKDLVNWEIVNYCYDILEDCDALALRKGQNAYGKGSWAASLRYNDGMYYVVVPSSTTGKTYVFKTNDIENGDWEKNTLDGVYHDLSILFEDEKAYMVYGGSTLRIKEMKPDLSAFIGEEEVLIPNLGNAESGDYIVQGEGAHIQKINGKYYIFIISWPKGGCRTELCYRSDTLKGPYEVKTILQDDGVAQGGIIDTPDGKNWYGMLFKDHGAVGRVPVLVPVTWKDGWPMMGVDGKVPKSMDIPVQGMETKSIVASDEFYQGVSKEEEAAQAIEEEEVGAELGKELLVNGDAEDGLEPWFGNEGATVEVSEEQAASGNHSIKVTNRKTPAAGPAFNMTGKIVAGGEYQFSCKIKYTEGPDTQKFNVCFRPGDSWRFIWNIGSVTATKGEWATVTAKLTVPEDVKGYHEVAPNKPLELPNAAELYMKNIVTFIETPPDDKNLVDFYADDFSVKEMSIPGLIDNGGFEDGTTSWEGKDSATLKVVTEDPVTVSNCLKVTNRTSTGSGPKQKFAKVLKVGDVIDYSVKLRYDEGADEEHVFNLCFWYGSSDYGKIQVIKGQKVKRGEWVELKGTYTVPAEIGELQLTDADLANTSVFIETAWAQTPTAEKDLMDFYVDDVVLNRKEFSKPGDLPIQGENATNGSYLRPEWQWNHNPENNGWSLKKRNGYLRLENTTLSNTLMDARNTLTQRTFGPTCSAKVKLDITNMKNGDYTGLTTFANKYAFVGAKKTGDKNYIVMVTGEGDQMQEEASVLCEQNEIYLKADVDYTDRADKANFYYSLDGINWTKIGTELAMVYDLTHFMGYRFGLFNYATKLTGGIVDFDYFRVDSELTGEKAVECIYASMPESLEIVGMQNTKVEIPVEMDAVGECNSIEASFMIPDCMKVKGVAFDTDNVRGITSYDLRNGQLTLKVTGENVEFSNKPDSKLFATIQLELAENIAIDKSVEVVADFVKVSGAQKEVNTNGVKTLISIKKADIKVAAKKVGNANPIMDNQFAADPYAITYDGRVYVYMTNDSQEYDVCAKDENGIPTDEKGNTFAHINTISVVSSADMVNWTDHGEIAVAGKKNPNGIAKWATCSWAPAACHKEINGKEQFFLYFADGGGGIGVLVADTPIGPFREPNGPGSSQLIAPGSKAAEGVVWLFDPAVLVDDDGTGYLFYGGGVPEGKDDLPGTGRVVKLKDNMYELDGDPKDTGAIALFEDSGIHKYNGKYYYSYCSNFTNNDQRTGCGNICYMVSDKPMGPYTYAGKVLENMGVFFGTGGNNHHAFFEFEGKNYITYHAQTLGKELGFICGYRSTHINEVEYDGEGNIKPITADYKGVSQLKKMDAYERIEGETFAWQCGTKVEMCDTDGTISKDVNTMLTSIENDDWTAVSNVDFGDKGAKTLAASLISKNGGTVEVYLDDPSQNPVATLEVAATGEKFETQTWDVSGMEGIHNVFFKYKGTGADIMSIDYWQFTEKKMDDSEKPGEGNSETSTETSSEAGTETSSEAGTETSSEAGTQTGTETSTQTNTQKPGNQTSSQKPGNQTSTQKPGNQTSTQKPVVKPRIKLNYKKLDLQVKKSTKAVKIASGVPAGVKIKSAKTNKKSVVSVSVKKGVLTLKGKKIGTATVTVTGTNGAKAKIKINVKKKVSTKKLTIAKKKLSLKKGKSLKLKPQVTPVTSTDKVTYKSSNKKVVLVSRSGKIKAKKKGTAKITIKSGKKKLTCTIKVK